MMLLGIDFNQSPQVASGFYDWPLPPFICSLVQVGCVVVVYASSACFLSREIVVPRKGPVASLSYGWAREDFIPLFLSVFSIVIAVRFPDHPECLPSSFVRGVLLFQRRFQTDE